MIRALTESDADGLAALRRASLEDVPLAFASSPDDDFAARIERVRAYLRAGPDRFAAGAFERGLVGVVGLYRDHHTRAAHKAHIWGMYVMPEHRGRGLGGALLRVTLDHARSLPGVTRVHLSASSAAPAARRLYERAGFTLWATEPDAMRHDGQSVTDYHMVLELDRAGSG
jgi:RimJ/RimL family protein N-acetyltransferase